MSTGCLDFKRAMVMPVDPLGPPLSWGAPAHLCITQRVWHKSLWHRAEQRAAAYMNPCIHHVSRTLACSSAQGEVRGSLTSDPRLQTVSKQEGIWGVPIHQFSESWGLARGTAVLKDMAQIRVRVSGKVTLLSGWRKETGSISQALNCFTGKMSVRASVCP